MFPIAQSTIGLYYMRYDEFSSSRMDGTLGRWKHAVISLLGELPLNTQ